MGWRKRAFSRGRHRHGCGGANVRFAQGSAHRAGGRVACNVENSTPLLIELRTGKNWPTANTRRVKIGSPATASPGQGWKTREEMEADEARVLAPFAQKSSESRGRQYPE